MKTKSIVFRNTKKMLSTKTKKNSVSSLCNSNAEMHDFKNVAIYLHISKKWGLSNY